MLFAKLYSFNQRMRFLKLVGSWRWRDRITGMTIKDLFFILKNDWKGRELWKVWRKFRLGLLRLLGKQNH